MTTPEVVRDYETRFAKVLVGGKAANLAKLGSANVGVPPWFCVTSAAWSKVLGSVLAGLPNTLASIDPASAASVRQASAVLVDTIVSIEIPDELRMAIGTAVEGLGARYYAVRSSATSEDSQRDSFAGQLDTFLFVPPEEVVDRVRRCWASLFGERCLTYMLRREIDVAKAAVAVVVQRIEASRCSGVMFTAEPTGAFDELLIVAGYGLGEGVVTDQVETDTYRYHPRAGNWDLDVTQKTGRLVFDRTAGSGTYRELVDEPLRSTPVLTDTQQDDLRCLGEKIERLFACPQDIEWLYDNNGKLWITQTRPITTIAAQPVSVFDNSNIVESYPGLTLPLTFSHVRHSYEVLFRGALTRIGVSRSEIDSASIVFENLLGHIHGRVYYNLTNWYRMLALIPGAGPYVPVWEQMLGIACGLREQRQRLLTNIPRMTLVASHFLWYFLALGPSMRALHRRFQRACAEFKAADLASMEPSEFIRRYDDLQRTLLPHWDITLLNDGYAFIFSGFCRYLLKRAGLSEEQFVRLAASGAPLESVEPLRSLIRIADSIRASPKLRASIQGVLTSADPLREMENSETSSFVATVRTHLDRYGDRCGEELKLESKSFRDNPAELLKLALGYANVGLSADEFPARDDDDKEADRALRRALRWRVGTRMLLALCLRAARRSIRYREGSRLDRARAFGLVRTIFAYTGKRLYEQGRLDRPRDVFYLTVGELRGVVADRSADGGLGRIIDRRKKEMSRFRRRDLPARFRLGETVEASEPQPMTEDTVRAAGSLRGTGCSPGVVTAEARIMRSLELSEDVRGKILVAPMTDPGWVFLMVSAAGLIVEKGSLLSHTAIIGRELGIPTVVGAAGATQTIPNGSRLRIDGQSGEIFLMEGKS